MYIQIKNVGRIAVFILLFLLSIASALSVEYRVIEERHDLIEHCVTLGISNVTVPDTASFKISSTSGTVTNTRIGSVLSSDIGTSNTRTVAVPISKSEQKTICWNTDITDFGGFYGSSGNWSINPHSWYNTSWGSRFEINITENSGYDRVREPIYFIGDFNCSLPNKADLRVTKIVGPDQIVIPHQVTGTGVFIQANVSGNFSGEWGYIYCKNPTAQNVTYTSPLNVSGDKKDWNITTTGGADLWTLDEGLPRTFTIASVNAPDVSGAAREAPAWREASNNFFGTGAGSSASCDILNNGSLVFTYNCSRSTGQSFYADWYAWRLQWRLYNMTSPTTTSMYFGGLQFGGVVRSHTWRNESTGIFRRVNSPGGQVCYDQFGFTCSFVDGNTWCYGVAYNHSTQSAQANGVCGYWRNAVGDDPFAGVFTDTAYDTESFANLNVMPFLWIGMFPASATANATHVYPKYLYPLITELSPQQVYSVDSIPSIVEHYISPAEPTTDNTLSCYVRAIDNDPLHENLSINWTWYNNTVLYDNGIYTNYMNNTLTLITTVPSAITEPLQNWTCSLQAFDIEYSYSNVSNYTVTIANSNTVQSLSNFDLGTTPSVILFGLLVLVWLAFLVGGTIFKNVAWLAFSTIFGIIIGILVFSTIPFVGIVFIFVALVVGFFALSDGG